MDQRQGGDGTHGQRTARVGELDDGHTGRQGDAQESERQVRLEATPATHSVSPCISVIVDHALTFLVLEWHWSH